jgi:hypothetical protein
MFTGAAPDSVFVLGAEGITADGVSGAALRIAATRCSWELNTAVARDRARRQRTTIRNYSVGRLGPSPPTAEPCGAGRLRREPNPQSSKRSRSRSTTRASDFSSASAWRRGPTLVPKTEKAGARWSAPAFRYLGRRSRCRLLRTPGRWSRYLRWSGSTRSTLRPMPKFPTPSIQPWSPASPSNSGETWRESGET